MAILSWSPSKKVFATASLLLFSDSVLPYTLLFILKCSFVVVGGTTGARGSINRDVKEERGGLIEEEDPIKWVKMAIIVSWISIVLTLAFGIAGLFIAITGTWHLSHHSKHIQMICFCPHIICSGTSTSLGFLSASLC